MPQCHDKPNAACPVHDYFVTAPVPGGNAWWNIRKNDERLGQSFPFITISEYAPNAETLARELCRMLNGYPYELARDVASLAKSAVTELESVKLQLQEKTELLQHRKDETIRDTDQICRLTDRCRGLSEELGDLRQKLTESENAICRKDAQLSAQEEALAHWRKESDRDAGAILRLKAERNQVWTSIAAQSQRADAAVRRVHQLEAKVRDSQRDRGPLHERINRLEKHLEGCDAGRSELSLQNFLIAKQAWSRATFGADFPLDKIVAHIRKECDEILAAPHDLSEPIDIALLAIDLYWRQGGKPEDFLQRLRDKHEINVQRRWSKTEDGTVEHVRE